MSPSAEPSGEPGDAASTGTHPGVMRAQAIDLALSGSLDRPSPFAAWARNLIGTVRDPSRGVMTAGVPESWREVLAWSGLPLSPHGVLCWGRDLSEDPALTVPVVGDGHLHLPPARILASVNGPGLRPLRRFIAERCQVRLQTAPGVRMWIWPDRVLLVSLRSDTVGGFLYAPTPDQRCPVLLEPGGWQVIRW